MRVLAKSSIRYTGNSGIYPTYLCNRQRREGRATQDCMSFRCDLLDDAVSEEVLKALRPAELQLALAALQELEARDQGILRQWQMRLERAEYEVALAERRYQEVDPSNRLVANTLERRWNEALLHLQDPRFAFTLSQAISRFFRLYALSINNHSVLGSRSRHCYAIKSGPNWQESGCHTVLMLASTNSFDILVCIMMRIKILSLRLLCLCVPRLCPAQQLITAIQLSVDETARAKQVTEELKNAQARLDKASAAWAGFRKGFQAEHPDSRNLRFSSDIRIAFALSDEEVAPGVKQATSVELELEERRKLEALAAELTESKRSLKQAQTHWNDFQNELVADHISQTPGVARIGVTLSDGKTVGVAREWLNGIALTPDFRFAVQRQFG